MKKIIEFLLPHIHGKAGEQVRMAIAALIGSALTSLGALITKWFGAGPDPVWILGIAGTISYALQSALNTWAQAYVAGQVIDIQTILNKDRPHGEKIAVDAWLGEETKTAVVQAVAVDP